MHPVLPPRTWAFRAMVYKHDCILLEHLVSLLPASPKNKYSRSVEGACLHDCSAWAGMIYLAFLVAGDRAPCSGWCLGQGRQLLKATPLAIPRIPSTGLPAWTLSKLAMSFAQHGTSQVGFTRCKRVIFLKKYIFAHENQTLPFQILLGSSKSRAAT